ncbi:MAG: hypothetical protein IPL61_11265 [Myxococcales bacterium]|nr:hypothetical protein [Myxococcales bacterium]
MPQVTEFIPTASDARATFAALGRVAREMPAAGEPFRDLRSRLRAAKLWDKERPAAALRVLGVGGATIAPSPFVTKLKSVTSDDDVCDAFLDRYFEINPLLFKTVYELLGQRAHGKDELSKYLGSFAYRGKLPSRPDLEHYFAALVAGGVARILGIALILGPRADRFASQVAALDADELLETDQPLPEPVIPVDDEVAPAAAPEAAADDAASAGTAAPSTREAAPLPPYLRHLAALDPPPASPRGRDRVVPLSGFGNGEISDELLDETTRRIGAWSADLGGVASPYAPADFGFDPEDWVEGADEVIYRVAVAAALVFRLDVDRAGVLRAYRALEQAEVLGDLYHGTVPDNLPAAVDARALMLASLAARRCAETPELAATIEQQKTAAEAWAVLEGSLGRGLFRLELFWILGMLGQLGVIRFDDLGQVTALPHRIVRDTLFRLGFLASPYAPDSTTLLAAARAARRAAGGEPADEIVARFAIAAGCAYDCPHRKTCDFPCRERLE